MNLTLGVNLWSPQNVNDDKSIHYNLSSIISNYVQFKVACKEEIHFEDILVKDRKTFETPQ